MRDFATWLPIALNVFIFGALAAGGAVVWRRQSTKELTSLQERVITALRQENGAQEDAIQTFKQKIDQLESTIATIRVALERRGVHIRIDGQYVTITDAQVPRQVTVKITKAHVLEQATKHDALESEEARSKSSTTDDDNDHNQRTIGEGR